MLVHTLWIGPFEIYINIWVPLLDTLHLLLVNYKKNIMHLHCKDLCAVLSHFSHFRLFVTQCTVACQAPLSIRILQARILEWVTMSSSRGPSWPKDQTVTFRSPALADSFVTTSDPWEAIYIHIYVKVKVKVKCLSRVSLWPHEL